MELFWEAFDVSSKRSELDSTQAEIARLEEASAASRKRLGDQTKSFRKVPDPEKLATFGGLLKAYQSEIDQLTRRSRYSEVAFLALYKALHDAPDPAPLLRQASQDRTAVARLEAEASKLRRDVEEYEAEFATLKNQDITIRELEEKLQEYETNIEKITKPPLAIRIS